MIVPTKLSSIMRVSVSVLVTVTPLHVVVLATLSLLLIIVSYTLYVDDTVAVWFTTVTLKVTEGDTCVFCYCLILFLLAAAELLVLDCV